MSKFATKAAANMFCQARYEAAKSNERLSSREGAAEEIGIEPESNLGARYHIRRKFF